MIVVGKAMGKPTYNCPVGDGKAPFTDKCNLYSLGDLSSIHQKYLEAGSPNRRQADFQNLVNEPLLSGDENDLVIDKLNPPSLHINIGLYIIFIELRDTFYICIPYKFVYIW